MEDKRLNFGLPIHSTRRFAPLPFYKSELKSGPVCSPGAVPFMWEKSPGMPKTAATESDSRESSFEDCITEEVGSTTTSTCLEDEGDGDAEVYSDAPEELSRTESFFFNCSLGGISGLEEGADTRPFSADLKVQDLMMGRFLPAAQAMAAETPTHVNRKQPARVVEETMCRTRNAPKQLRYEECKPDLSPNYAPELYRVETDDDDEGEDGDCSLSEDHSMRGCGFLMRFCVKAPFRIMNVVPATNLKAGNAIDELHSRSSNKVRTTIPWLKQKYAGHTRTPNPKVYNLGRSSLKASVLPKPENSPLPTKIQACRYRPRFLHEKGCASNLSESDTKRKNDSLPREKPSTSFRDLLARENEEWNSGSNVADCGRKDDPRVDASESKTDHRDAAVAHPESSIRNIGNLGRQQGKVDSNRSSENETPERDSDPVTTRLRKVNHENSRGHYSNLPLSPPTESWLVRTLPFTPSPNRAAFPRSPLAPTVELTS